jgi:AraC-like DNA-binding protein
LFFSLLACGSLRSCEELTDWVEQRARAVGGLWSACTPLFVSFRLILVQNRAHLSDPFQSDRLVALPDEPQQRLHSELIQQAHRRLDQLKPKSVWRNVPKVLLSVWSSIDDFLEEAVALNGLMEGDARFEQYFTVSYKESLARANLPHAAEVAMFLAPYLSRSGRATEALSMFRTMAKMSQIDRTPNETAWNVLYGRYRTALAAGLTAEALDAYRRYVISVRSIVVAGLQIPALHASAESALSVRQVPLAGAPAYLSRATSMIRDSFRDKSLTQEIIASHAGVSTRTLRAAFSIHLGVSPREYLRNIRLEAAYRMLTSRPSTKQQTIKELAESCGMDHAGRFARAFFERYGCSPSEVSLRPNQ